MKRILILLAAAIFASQPIHPQTKLPAFDVSTVKPSNSTTGATRFFFAP